VFKKTAELYETLANYPAAAVVEVNGVVYVFYHNGGGEFVIGKGRATELYEVVERLGIRARFKKNLLLLTYAQLREPTRRGFAVRFLSDVEKEVAKEVYQIQGREGTTTLKNTEEKGVDTETRGKNI